MSAQEIRLVDHPIFQRLRNVKQLGFSDLAFPGATHTRYSHSLGATHIATRLFDRLFTPADLPPRVFDRFRQAVRLAMLFHDIGHAPLSHTTEMIMPPVGELGLGILSGADVGRRATHEDYTLKMILDSSLSESIREKFSQIDIAPEDVAELIAAERGAASGRFRHAGLDYSPVLRQIVSSECDADRMDYLQRDSFFSGVNYGKFDADWLIDNVAPIDHDGAVHLGIRSRAIFSFEDFLLSRYHMFASVYLHYTPVVFEKMLSRYFESAPEEFTLPADVEKYAKLDDLDLWTTLRKSENPWARRIVERKPYTLLDEINQRGLSIPEAFHPDLCATLRDENIDVIFAKSKSVLSKYFGGSSLPIFVLSSTHAPIPLEEFTPLYERYKEPARLSRVFVNSDDRHRAREILKSFRKARL